ncbi:hypothetical protein BHE90_014051 [Fusarium euwallaceae]|uniref:Uncharacterized protein n=1 Tax=Fusarium euwallaceae TaxID=1147111 RepID=A0A430L770_9HYPO|nr:hypothetical protein BHE90_014051 [Fusarium euwallaceae]
MHPNQSTTSKAPLRHGTIDKMSASEKRKLASPDEMQRHVDGLVGSGAILLEHGKRLKVGNDGLLQVTGPVEDSALTRHSSARERVFNIVNYLKSSAGPKSVSWYEALIKLNKLLDNKHERKYYLDIHAWDICQAANDETIDDITFMDMLYHRLQDGSFGAEWVACKYNIIEFPQRACRLLGIAGPDDFIEEAWYDGLGNQMLKKDPEAHSLINQGFRLMMEDITIGFGEAEEDKIAAKFVGRFQKLEPVKALETVMETEELLILERKAKTAKRVQEARQARITNRA